MPCTSDYRDPSTDEVKLSKVYALLDEIRTGILPEYYGDGMSSRVYGITTPKILDKETSKLCSKLQLSDVTKYSLEMQMWWRDHQAADKKRLTDELIEMLKEKDKKVALSKLTPYERGLLGL